ncbi:hypothetical protein GQ44DRAFT_596686, partial [Phaeosphaeriaceae sp. PMI808]
IPRPMNSFMLYRSAYLERAKSWCMQKKQQVVLALLAKSWFMEKPEIRDQFRNHAKIETLNHHAAHPSYRFFQHRKPPKKR